MRVLAPAALAAVLLVAAWAPTGAGRAAAELRVVDRLPFTVVGEGFERRERVRLTLRAGNARPSRATARADGAGRFRARFDPLVLVEPCRGALVVTATGSEGTRATWKRACRPPSTRPPRVAP